VRGPSATALGIARRALRVRRRSGATCGAFALPEISRYPHWMQNSLRIFAGIIIIVILALIGLAFFQKQNGSGSPVSTSTPEITSTTSQNGVTGTGNFQVTGDTVNITVPDFRAPLKFSPDIQADVKAALQNAAIKLQAKLATDSLDLGSWINLGTIRKMGGDYTGAEKAWLFVTQAAPSNPLAYSNLGDLYENFIKNYPKAEQSYLTELKLNPKDEGTYLNLYTMYANMYKQGTSAAEDILKKGVAAIPNSVNLHVQLARYYKGKGDKADAKKEYDAAIAAANKAGQSAVASELQAEENQ
jgi:hypothetical protein